MRIFVLTSLYPGPPKPFEGIFAERRWQAMRRRGHEVTVVQPLPYSPGGLAWGRWAAVRGMPRREQRNGIPVRRPRYLHWPGRHVPNARRFARAALPLLCSEVPPPDVLVADYSWPAGAIAPHLEGLRIPCVISGRGSDILQAGRQEGLSRQLAGFLQQAGTWCGVSRQLVDEMDEIAGRPGRGHLVPNGVDLETFTVRRRSEARRYLRLDDNSALLLVVGHLIERKDPLLALDVFRSLGSDDFRCFFVGRGPLRGALEARIREYHLENRVEIIEEQRPEDLARWFAAADLVLLTSHREGRPNVILEALSCGRPVVATNAGGTSEILAGRPELLATTRDPKQIAALVEKLANRPPEPGELRELVTEFSWENSSILLERCLQESIGRLASQ